MSIVATITTATITMFVLSGTMMSCNTDSGKISSGFQPSNTAREDSIKKVKELEIEQARQDSIEQSQIKRYHARKLSGKHKYGGTTRIEYKSLYQLLGEVETQAKKEMWTDQQKLSKLNGYKMLAKGGQLRLDIERNTIGGANTQHFSMIVKDMEENEIYRVDLDHSIPETPSGNDYWWNISIEHIEKRIKPPFYVYVVDKIQDEVFKFEVTGVKTIRVTR
jgi:hypothetical protein